MLLIPFLACQWNDPCWKHDCSDHNPCTRDYCVAACEAQCKHEWVDNGTGCSVHGESGRCVDGVCDLCSGIVCEDDRNPCTQDVCDPADGTCGVPTSGSACPYKGLFPGFCAFGFCAKSLCEDGTCDDGNECTDDTCDSAARRCRYGPVEHAVECDLNGAVGVCLDGLCRKNFCEGVSCDDQNDCTDDTCNYRDGRCEVLPVEDGTPCQRDGFGSICVSGECQPECASSEDCDDGNECTDDLCSDGVCALLPVTDGTACDDGNECTDDLCRNGVCAKTFLEDGTTCRDGEGACRAGRCAGPLLWPIDCIPGETCDRVVHYPDLDEDGRAFDCVSPTYCCGTGIGITWQQMDAGVDVLAAAPGQVIWVFDGKYDRCHDPYEPDCQPPSLPPPPGNTDGNTVCTELGDYCGQGDCCCYWCFSGGNVVVIRHVDAPGVFATRYDHLKNGSIAVTEGEFVEAGQKVAEVGSSGASNGPHLYFEVWGTGFYQLADPWPGPCGSNLSDPLWAFDPPWAEQEQRVR